MFIDSRNLREVSRHLVAGDADEVARSVGGAVSEMLCRCPLLQYTVPLPRGLRVQQNSSQVKKCNSNSFTCLQVAVSVDARLAVTPGERGEGREIDMNTAVTANCHPADDCEDARVPNGTEV